MMEASDSDNEGLREVWTTTGSAIDLETMKSHCRLLKTALQTCILPTQANFGDEHKIRTLERRGDVTLMSAVGPVKLMAAYWSWGKNTARLILIKKIEISGVLDMLCAYKDLYSQLYAYLRNGEKARNRAKKSRNKKDSSRAKDCRHVGALYGWYEDKSDSSLYIFQEASHCDLSDGISVFRACPSVAERSRKAR